MNQRQKNFITKKLIPFILREQGNGFAMSTWRSRYSEAFVEEYGLPNADGIQRTKLPVCRTVACIGGSIDFLRDTGKVKGRKTAIMGLSRDQLDKLFHGWAKLDTGWPRKFQDAYAEANTTIAKARVAVRLLKEVIRTNGECLNG